MPIIPAGSLNTTALVVPNIYVQIVPPQPALNGVPSNVIGVVGTAAWGPVDVPTNFGSYAEFQGLFGPLQNALFDMGTAVAVATLQNANAFYGVRVTDGTDVKASANVGTSPFDITYTALYSGTTGNSINVVLSPSGASASSWNVNIINTTLNANELFTNISGSGATFWSNLAAAINNGQGTFRGPSQLITATAGTGVTAPTAGTTTLTGGTNGTTSVTITTLIGVNTTPRTGMYTLANQGVSILLLADGTDSTHWSVIDQFASSIGAYNMVALPASTSISAAVTAVQAAALDSYCTKIMQGDWLYWYDQVNQLTRLVSPASFAAGMFGALNPSQSGLNKQIYGVVGSQTQGQVGTPQAHTYSSSDLSTLFSAGIDVISTPSPGGAYWSMLGGINSSLNAAENGDNYTTMTNYLAKTLNAGMGQFVGRVITNSMDQEAVATISSFLSNMWQQGLLGSASGPPPFTVQGGLGNAINPQSRTALGYYQINVNVTYAPINRFFIVNLQGGQTVVTSQSNLSPV